MTAQRIEELIPHRAPMRLIDEIVSISETEIVCRKTFAADDFFVQGHFPGAPIVPGVIQCECVLQAGAALLAARAESESAATDVVTVPVATRIDAVKFKRMVRPGDTVDVHATLKDSVSNAFFLGGKVTLGGKVAARLDFACSVASPRAEESS